ncbi:MAG TPA: LysR family transcriptional regulator [Sedimentisphaerales bacterium]|nr:LysR family transcriptional regulator [Sedimentisphaerales bacterium]
MQIETFQLFCDLVDLGSFSRAAEKHMVSQSAVSQQVAQLELIHKCQLIDRRKRPLTLTRAGELFYTACKDMVERYAQVSAELTSLTTSAEARVRVAAIFSIGLHTMPPYVKQFMARYPDINLNLEYISASRIYDLLLRGETDIGIVALPRKDSSLVVHPFLDEPLVLAVGREHPWAAQKEIDIHKIRFQKFIAFDAGLPTRIHIDNILASYNVPVRHILEFDNVETIKRAVEINAGISILPEPSVHQERLSGAISVLTFTNEKLIRPTALLIRKDKTLTAPTKYFIELLTHIAPS